VSREAGRPAAEPPGAGPLAVVVPARNEEASIEPVVQAFAGLAAVDLVIVVDNGSDDRTAERARAAGARVLAEPRPGDGAALRAGIEHALASGAARVALVESLPRLEITPSAAALAQSLLTAGAVPAEAPRDALHIAVAAIHGVAYLATWNFKHIANVTKRLAIMHALESAGYSPPTIATPEDLLEVINL